MGLEWNHVRRGPRKLLVAGGKSVEMAREERLKGGGREEYFDLLKNK